MRDALKFELRRSIKPFLVLAIVGIVLYVFVILGSYTINVGSFTSYIGIFTFVSILILIFYNFGYNKKRISLDLYYSLPVTHKELFLAKYLFTLAEIIVLLLVLMGFSYVLVGLLSRGLSIYNVPIYLTDKELLQMFYIILIQMVSAIALTNVILLFFNLANNYLDAALYILIVVFLPLIIFVIFDYILGKIDDSHYYLELNYGLYEMLRSWCIYYVCGTNEEFYALNTQIGLIITACCFLAFIPLYIYTVNSYAEKVELPDTKIFGYKILVPTFCISFIIYYNLGVYNVETSLIWLGVFLVIQYVAYAVFERTIKISKSSLIILIFTLILGLILAFTNII